MTKTEQLSLATLERRLRRLEDEASVAGLLYAYADRFDRRDSEGVADLFTVDAVVDYGPELENLIGRPAINAGVAKGHAEIFQATSHHITNPVVHVEGDTARCTAYVYAWHRYQGAKPDGYLWGRYTVDCLRRCEGWQIDRLHLAAAGTQTFHRGTMHPIGRRP